MRIGIVQPNPTVGDLVGNVERCLSGIRQAAELGAGLIVLPEMAVPGCHPKDILFDSQFITAVGEATADLAALAEDYPPTIIGTIMPAETPPGLYNAAVLLTRGTARMLAAKRHLPNFDVFFESRWFAPGPPPDLHRIAGVKVVVLVGGELSPAAFDAQPDIIINLAASPFYRGVRQKRWAYAKNLPAPLVYANLVGGNDELIYDGRSFISQGDQSIILPGFEEAVRVVGLAGLPEFSSSADEMETIKKALVLGIRDFARKNGIRRAFLGLSGGIDSSVVAALAAEALSPSNVTGVAMPSRYTDPRSKQAAEQLAKNLGIGFEIAPISPLHDAAESALPALFGEGVGAENVQARLRMMILMGYVNKYGGMLLNTGNKTESTLGYATLYGDTAGALGPIADLTKPEVYELAHMFNAEKEIIPQFALARAPSAELKPGQVDPFDYDEISPQLEELVRHNQTNPAMRAAEHKRTQMGVVLKVSQKAFGSGRMIPITRR